MNARVAETAAARAAAAAKIKPDLKEVQARSEAKVLAALESDFSATLMQDEVDLENKKSSKGVLKPKVSKTKAPKTKVSAATKLPALTVVTSVLLLVAKHEGKGKTATRKQYAFMLWSDGPSIHAVVDLKTGPWVMKEYRHAMIRGSASDTRCAFCLEEGSILNAEELKAHQTWHGKYRRFFERRREVFPEITKEPFVLDSKNEIVLLTRLVELWKEVDPSAAFFVSPPPATPALSLPQEEDEKIPSYKTSGMRRVRRQH